MSLKVSTVVENVLIEYIRKVIDLTKIASDAYFDIAGGGFVSVTKLATLKYKTDDLQKLLEGIA